MLKHPDPPMEEIDLAINICKSLHVDDAHDICISNYFRNDLFDTIKQKAKISGRTLLRTDIVALFLTLPFDYYPLDLSVAFI